ncbi:putative spore germination protein GerPC [Paenibacillus allorhizoplanae]|uniref:Spore germination protein GerPC n=1 Tax=Paenibacillus allorhizoplanae TaxID=2905648 RepID=A0ABN8GLP9_9BACL|nr:spore germination protein GerPC [Paenibacillus allorhizoplanae]CAH1206323.1 putative spore germination protein GerPC [Paenibacillus allorhizoplanae]
MNNAITWQQWAQQITTCLEMQKQRIDKLEQTVNKLQADLKAMKDEKRIHIDKIEYNFDQLKVEKLDGTLTIGISPSAIDQIEDLSVNGNSLNKESNGGGMAPMDMNPFYQGGQYQGTGPSGGIGAGQETVRGEAAKQGKDIQADVASGIEQYLQFGVQGDINNLEHKYQHPLDEDYKDLIIEDIRKQLDTRIQHYVNQYRGVGFKEPLEAVTNNIMDKTKQDILTAIETYISSLPK